MAGSSVTFTYQKFGPIKKIIADIVTDDTTGAASGETAALISGKLLKIVTNPGSAAPTANWDVLLTDSDGNDPCARCQNAAALVARHTTNTEQTNLQLLNDDATAIGIASHPVISSRLTLALANAGNSKTAQVILYVEGDIQGG